MNLKFIGGGRIKPLLKIFNTCKSLTGVGLLYSVPRQAGGGRNGVFASITMFLQWMEFVAAGYFVSSNA